ncbi:MAG: hypothetical protein ACRED5_21170 [Propylenella sp.]
MLAVYDAPAQAQATRTWVSGVGDDLNPCSRTAPCKTFAGAISKTAAGGEISVLDPGGFGAVTITKSISIVSDGSEGSILATANTNGIIINAGVNDVVSISGIYFEGANTGLNGIRVLSAGRVHIRNCLIRGFRGTNGSGIDVNVGVTTRVLVDDTTVANNFAGIKVRPVGATTAVVVLSNVIVDGNLNQGLLSDGANSFLRFGDSIVTSNATGLSSLNTGKLQSFGNNFVFGNTVDGAPTSTIPRV